uniref:Uncharacterized protein n=2 Tax=root TaxID=1 RepID=A0A8S5NNM4_9CAUD|nr:MAG TPA: hypothetical protein [Siphoviridae sp. ctQU013]DAF24179.1 MAG TPA: hypothetical protein [Caudoviricetes sp.]DAG75421.1 MAG TPA: hypothetical protein [Caudoviricetes sp.]DAZ24361.1 MAG TPA: hypothetical protein [Caudoviricetes sp.]
MDHIYMKNYIKRNENLGQRMRDMELKEAFFRGVATGVKYSALAFAGATGLVYTIVQIVLALK